MQMYLKRNLRCKLSVPVSALRLTAAYTHTSLGRFIFTMELVLQNQSCWDVFVSNLQPADIARLAGTSWNFFDPCRDSRLWSRFFVRDFKRPVARGPADEGLPLYIQV